MRSLSTDSSKSYFFSAVFFAGAFFAAGFFAAVVFFAAGFFAAVVFFAAAALGAAFFAAGFLAAAFFGAALAFTIVTGLADLRLRVLPYDPRTLLPFLVFISPLPIMLSFDLCSTKIVARSCVAHSRATFH